MTYAIILGIIGSLALIVYVVLSVYSMRDIDRTQKAFTQSMTPKPEGYERPKGR